MASPVQSRPSSHLYRTTSLSLTVLLTAFLIAGCMDADPFRLAYRRITGEYELYESESKHYYLERDGYDHAGVGYLQGTIRELGWTGSHIFVRRSSSVGRDSDGWMIIYLRTNVVIGPLSDAEFQRRFPNAVVYPAGQAWARLG